MYTKRDTKLHAFGSIVLKTKGNCFKNESTTSCCTSKYVNVSESAGEERIESG